MTLQTNQRVAIEQLASGATVAQAASVAGVTESTVYKWRSDNANGFMDALKEANERILSDTVTMLSAASVKAVQALMGVLDDKNADNGHVISASKAILDSTIQLRKLYDMEARLSELERLYHEQS